LKIFSDYGKEYKMNSDSDNSWDGRSQNDTYSKSVSRQDQNFNNFGAFNQAHNKNPHRVSNSNSYSQNADNTSYRSKPRRQYPNARH
jgi:hypothetical protein